MDLELRKRTLETLGWKCVETDEGFTLYSPDGLIVDDYEFTLGNEAPERWRLADPVESDAGVAITALDKWCRENDVTWSIILALQGHYICVIVSNTDKLALERGATIPLACCRSLIAASQAQKGTK